MNKSKKILLFSLLGVLIVCCIATVIISRHETKKEEIKNSDEIVMEISPDSVTSLSWNYDETSLAFTKDGDTWKYDEDEAFPVDEEKIDNLLSIFESFGVSFEIYDVTDYSQYGLDKPTCTIEIGVGDTTYTVKLGSFSTLDSKRYVSIADDGKVYLVNVDPMDSFETTIEKMIKDDELPNMTSITSMEVEGDDSYSIEYQENAGLSVDADDVYFTEGKPLDSNLVSSYVSSLGRIDQSNYVTYNATDAELAEYGLDQPDLTVSVTYDLSKLADGETHMENFVLHVGRPESAKEADKESDTEIAAEDTEAGISDMSDSESVETEASDDPADYGYVRIGDSKIIYRISMSTYESLMEASYDDLRHKEVITADFDEVTSIEVTIDGANYSFTKGEEDEDGNVIWKDNKDEEVEVDSVKSAILGLSADSFVDQIPSDVSDTTEEISFTLHLNNEVCSEITINVLRYNGENCIIKENGQVVSLVSRSDVVDLMEAVRALVL